MSLSRKSYLPRLRSNASDQRRSIVHERLFQLDDDDDDVTIKLPGDVIIMESEPDYMKTKKSSSSKKKKSKKKKSKDRKSSSELSSSSCHPRLSCPSTFTSNTSSSVGSKSAARKSALSSSSCHSRLTSISLPPQTSSSGVNLPMKFPGPLSKVVRASSGSAAIAGSKTPPPPPRKFPSPLPTLTKRSNSAGQLSSRYGRSKSVQAPSSMHSSIRQPQSGATFSLDESMHSMEGSSLHGPSMHSIDSTLGGSSRHQRWDVPNERRCNGFAEDDDESLGPDFAEDDDIDDDDDDDDDDNASHNSILSSALQRVRSRMAPSPGRKSLSRNRSTGSLAIRRMPKYSSKAEGRTERLSMSNATLDCNATVTTNDTESISSFSNASYPFNATTQKPSMTRSPSLLQIGLSKLEKLYDEAL